MTQPLTEIQVGNLATREFRGMVAVHAGDLDLFVIYATSDRAGHSGGRGMKVVCGLVSSPSSRRSFTRRKDGSFRLTGGQQELQLGTAAGERRIYTEAELRANALADEISRAVAL